MKAQTGLAEQQSAIANTQLDIMRRQDEIMVADRARRAHLEVYITGEVAENVIRLLVKNSGNKTATSFYWHLLIPRDVMQDNQVWIDGKLPLTNKEVLDLENRAFSHFTSYTCAPLFPTRNRFLASFAIDGRAASGSYPVLWSTICEDGANPEEDGKLNKLEFRVGRQPS